MTRASNTNFLNSYNNNNNNAEYSSLLGCYAVSLDGQFQRTVKRTRNLDCLSLKITALMAYETSGTTHPTTQRHSPKHLHLGKFFFFFFFLVIFLIWWTLTRKTQQITNGGAIHHLNLYRLSYLNWKKKKKTLRSAKDGKLCTRRMEKGRSPLRSF
jgi:hypothetical protein